ncbi:MAG: NAD-dependent epimerase/dehydratase family protein [Lysobacterales bacterium]
MAQLTFPSRRTFLGAAGAAGLLSLTGTSAGAAPKHLLILGGTGFLGPHIVQAALANGHQVTLFNRGKTAPEMFPEVETLIGDRDGQLDALKDRDFDGVIDTSGYVPRITGLSASLLRERVPHYLFVSTISVYGAIAKPNLNEDAPVATLTEDTEQVTGATYGALKALSEQAVRAHYPNATTVLRPGLIVGPLDKTDRFTYWPVRVRRGGEVMAPGKPTTPMQFIDVRDLAAFILRCMEKRIFGTMNTDRPAASLTTDAMLNACLKFAPDGTRLTWVPAEFLQTHEVAPWQDMPAWVPADGDYAGFGQISTERAIQAGLSIRPLDQTVADTLDWFDESGRKNLRAGIEAEREAAVLKAWHQR